MTSIHGMVKRQTASRKRIGTALLLVLLTPAMVAPGPCHAASIGDGNLSVWKDGLTAAATLTIDDNWQQDHAWWTSTGNTYDARFTWFVITDRVGTGNLSVNGNWSDFIALQAAGHSIQSHSVDHFPNFPDSGPLPLETNYAQAITDIETNVPGSDVLTLAYPFGLSPTQNPDLNDRALAGQYYLGARGVVGTLNRLTGVDYLNVNSLTTDYYGTHGGFPLPGNVPDTHFAYIPNLITPGKADYQGWLSVHSHGLTDDKKTAITGLLDYLTTQPGGFWIAPFTDVSQYAQQRDAAQLTTQVIGAEKIEYTLTDTLDDTRFYQPLTVKVRVDNGWSQVVATQGGQPLPVTLIQEGGEQFALVDSVPDAGVVSLTEPIITGDFDEDGDVDGSDFLRWQRGHGILEGAQRGQGDANGDGAVDGTDLTIWNGQFGDLTAVVVTSVPEPATAVLGGLLLGLAMLSREVGGRTEEKPR